MRGEGERGQINLIRLIRLIDVNDAFNKIARLI